MRVRHLLGPGVLCLAVIASTLIASTQTASAGTPPPFVLMWGSYGTAIGQFRGPSGIAVDGSGDVFVVQVDNVYRAQKFTGTGTFITLWGGNGSGPGQFDFPHDVAVDGSGNVYIVEALNDRVQKFTNSGTYITQWGSYGSGTGQFNLPYGIAVDGNGNVFVVERSGNRVQKFTGSGTFLASWGSAGSGNGQFNQPRGISVDPSGNVYVSDTGNHRVQKFSNGGSYLGQFGSYGSGNGQFNQPGDIAVDGDGIIYVTDVGNHRVQAFTSGFVYDHQWGGFGFTAGKFLSPWGIEIGSNGYMFVVDGGNARIQKFGPVAPPGGGGSEPNTPAGTNVAVSLDPDTDLLYEQVTRGGTTTLDLMGSGPAPPAGIQIVSGGAPGYHELATSAAFTGTIEIAIAYDPADVQGAESDLKLFHYDESGATPVWRDITTSVRTGPNIIEGVTGSLSTFIVGEAAAPTGIEDMIGRPGTVRLLPGYPNPFRRSTRVGFELAEPGAVRLSVYDLRGRRVRVLLEGIEMPAGGHEVSWAGRDDEGRRLTPGVYFFRLEAPRARATRKVMLLD